MDQKNSALAFRNGRRNFSHDPKRVAALLGGEVWGGIHITAPGPGHSPKDRSLSISIGDDYPDGFIVNSWSNDDWLTCRDYICGRLGIDQRRGSSRSPPSRAKPARPQVRADAEVRRTAGSPLAIWNEAIDPHDTLAEKYLKGRKRRLDLPDDLCGRVLRFHPSCPWRTGRVPALIAAYHPINEPDDAAPPVAIMRVGLNADGTKIAKGMMLGPVGGCAIKLDADENVSHGLGIAEGLETALAVRATGWRPVWALGSAGAIEKFEPLAGIEALTIFADNDKSGAGIEAAHICAARWDDAGSEIFIKMPRDVGSDWADVA